MSGSGLSPLPHAVVHRLNVDHLSRGLGDHLFVWRSSLPPYPLIQWGRWPGHDYWVCRTPEKTWRRIGNRAVFSNVRSGERFIRVGRRLGSHHG